ncbi:MAG: hypothetical protein JNL08_10410 [Planctomycetes bacterium]|nr:hypothetical protein [Planctomycetota bacterium]
MAQGVRTSSAVAASALLALAGCGDAPATPTPRAVDLAAIADAELVAAVLDECHRPLRGQLDRIAAVVTPPDGHQVQLFAELPRRLRCQTEQGSWLLVDDDAYRLGDDAAATVAAADRLRLQQLRTLLDAALFGPLHRATGCSRTGAATWQLAQPGGDPVTLALRPGTLLPAQLGQVQVLDYLRTPTTWIVRRAALDGLGPCDVRFVFNDLAWAPDFFAPPDRRDTAPRPATGTLRLPAQGSEPRSPVPVLVDAPALRVIVRADPGDWPGRCASYAPLHAELVRQQQRVAGFAMLWQQDGRAWLAAPFRRRDDGPEFAPPAGWTVRDFEAGRWLVVYPQDGDLAARVATGTRQLQDALAAQRLTAAGPVLAQPFVHLEEGEPPASKLAAPTVRMSVPVR